MEASIYTSGNLRFTEYVKVGSLRLRETLSTLEAKTVEFPRLIEEYIEGKTYSLEALIRQQHIKNFIGLGGGIQAIFSLCSKSKEDAARKLIDKKPLLQLYDRMQQLSTEEAAEEFNMGQSEAELLFPSVIIFKRFLAMTKAEGIYTPMVSLRHGILADMADNYFQTQRKLDSINDIISSVWYIGEKYGIDKVHASFVEHLSQ